MQTAARQQIHYHYIKKGDFVKFFDRVTAIKRTKYAVFCIKFTRNLVTYVIYCDMALRYLTVCSFEVLANTTLSERNCCRLDEERRRQVEPKPLADVSRKIEVAADCVDGNLRFAAAVDVLAVLHSVGCFSACLATEGSKRCHKTDLLRYL